MKTYVWGWVCALGLMLSSSVMAEEVSISGLKFSSLPGGKTEIRFEFDGQPPEPKSYTIASPARIAIDLDQVSNGLGNRYHDLNLSNAQSVTIIEARDRARVIVNLTELVPFSTRVDESNLYVVLGRNVEQVAASSDSFSTESQRQTKPRKAAEKSVTDVDFRRSTSGEGLVVISLSDPKVNVDLTEEGGRIRITLPGVTTPPELQRRLDVTDFATPVEFVDTIAERNQTVIFIESNENSDYVAYQADNEFTVSVKQLTAKELERLEEERFPFSGERLSLNFQDIEVRAVLQLIADFTGLNLVASDTVSGTITLRLQNVPWDQALDLILKTKGLDQRQTGNVLLIAPAEEIAARERLELETNRQVEELAPLRSEFIRIRYARATDIAELLSAENGLLSSRGVATVDERTNTMLIQDTAQKIADIREALLILDIPVRQVLIEARIVVASTDFDKELGIQFGGVASAETSGGNSLTFTGDTTSFAEFVDGEEITFPDAFGVDLGTLETATSTFNLGFLGANELLSLQLSAIEADGKGEVIAQPKLVTADGQTATLRSGTEIPFQEAASSGATSVSFRDAVLGLEVTPRITPDDQIIMDIRVNQDSVGEDTIAGPAIDTNEIETQVLVSNGETIVLGGVFNSTETKTVRKTPFFGDIPFIGRLFRATSVENDKSELLVFLTPKLVDDSLNIR